MNPTVKQWLPHLFAVIAMMMVSFIYFSAYVIDGKVLTQGDNLQARGMQQETRTYVEQGQPAPLWTNGTFAGMPAYQIYYDSKNALQYPFRALLLGNHMSPPHTGILLLMLGVYLMLVLLGVDWRIGLISAIGFGFCSHMMDLLEAGHSTKIIALGYAGPIIASVVVALRGRYVLGGALAGLFLGLQIYANHVQITYYTLIFSAIIGLCFLIDSFRKGTSTTVLMGAVALIIGFGLGFGSNTGRLWTTYEYSKATIRGESELKEKEASSGSVSGQSGLSKEYAFDWSYGRLEVYNLLVPNFMGGGSSNNFISEKESKTYKTLVGLGNNELANQIAQSGLTSHYWGEQKFVSGGFYLGTIILLLAFIGMVLVKGPLKWGLSIGMFLFMCIAMGQNFSTLNYFLFDHFPMFNKFRAVSMALTMVSLSAVTLAGLGLQTWFTAETEKEAKKKALYIGGGIVGGLLVLAYILSFGFLDFMSAQQISRLPETMKNQLGGVLGALAEDRAGLLQADVMRGLFFFAVGFAILWLGALQQKMKPMMVVFALLALTLVDMMGVARRQLSSEDFTDDINIRQYTAAKPADEQINQDPDKHFRVADFSGNPFSSAITSYHHKSMGGYHAAKLMRYQELIEGYLMDPGKNSKIYGMLNAKYFINQDGAVSRNPDALGNAWFVNEIKIVDNGDDEFKGLADINPKTTALVQSQYADGLKGMNIVPDSTASITLTSYYPDKMVYQTKAATDQLALFSEVYYGPDMGWKVLLDGKPVDNGILKANFILRGMKVPAGNHTIEMVFEPRAYYTGETISLVCSLLVLLLLVWALWGYIKSVGFTPAGHLPELAPIVAEKTATSTSPKKKK